MFQLKLFAGVAAGLFVSAQALAQHAQPAASTGRASYYNLKGRTASGARVGAFTAAHRNLAFGTRLKVTNLGNNRSVVVIVNDRGPFIRGRIVDVSAQAADALGFRRSGTAQVKIEALR